MLLIGQKKERLTSAETGSRNLEVSSGQQDSDQHTKSNIHEFLLDAAYPLISLWAYSP
jgi:hypothetical protein